MAKMCMDDEMQSSVHSIPIFSRRYYDLVTSQTGAVFLAVQIFNYKLSSPC